MGTAGVPLHPKAPRTHKNFPRRKTEGAGEGSFHSNAGFLIPSTSNAKAELERCGPLSLEETPHSHPHHLYLTWAHPDKQDRGEGLLDTWTCKGHQTQLHGDRPARGQGGPEGVLSALASLCSGSWGEKKGLTHTHTHPGRELSVKADPCQHTQRLLVHQGEAARCVTKGLALHWADLSISPDPGTDLTCGLCSLSLSSFIWTMGEIRESSPERREDSAWYLRVQTNGAHSDCFIIIINNNTEVQTPQFGREPSAAVCPAR